MTLGAVRHKISARPAPDTQASALAARLTTVQKLDSPDPIEDDVIRYTDRDDLAEMLAHAINRATELAIQRRFACPILVTLTDAKERCLLTVTLNRDESGWTGRTARGEFDQPSAIAFPWFLVAEDALGKKLRIRVELDSTFRPM